MQGGLRSTAAELRLHGEETGERGPGKPEGLGANQKVSHDAGEGVELTEAMGVIETQRQPQNRRRTTTSFTARVQSESERATVLG
jgi:hypothetical protein